MPAILLRILPFLKNNAGTIAAILAVLFFVYIGWHLRGLSEQINEAERQEKVWQEQERIDAQAHKLSVQYEEIKAQAAIINNQINEVVKDEVKKPEYNCAISTNGVQLYNKAIVGSQSAR